MIWVAAFFLVVALSAYVLFGGADFGGGILEATLPSRELKAKLQKTLAPVWEANHVWLIAVVVILFVGFPRFYASVMTRLYVPVSLALFAILVRGACFTLRKYDPAPGAFNAVYTFAFRLSSALAPFAFGLIIAGLLSVHPALEGLAPSPSFHAVYVKPWWDGFAFLCGIFIAVLFGYVASVFFYGELATDAERAVVAVRIRAFFIATFFLGGGVLLLGHATDRVPLRQGLHPVTLVCQAVALAGVFSLVRSMKKRKVWQMRLAAGAQVLAILGGWFAAQYPVLLRIQPTPLTIYSAAAPQVTLFWLNVGLFVVLGLVVPLLVFLYRVFMHRDPPTTEA